MTRPPTQRERVLAALRPAGRRGVTAVDFLAPAVIDGGPPVLGFAARISELGRNGHRIVVTGRRDKCRVFVLVEHPRGVPTESGRTDATDEALFDAPAAVAPSPYDAELEGGWSTRGTRWPGPRTGKGP